MRQRVFAAWILLLLCAPARARTWHVPAEAPTIAAGLAAAAPGDVVEVACGTYHEHGLALRPGVTLRSQTGESDCATIDGDHLDSVIVCESIEVPAVVEGFTLSHGFAQGLYPSGGGLECRTSTLSVRRCRFEDNTAGWGGGLRALNSRLTADDCVFTGNHADVGAAGVDCTGGSPAFANCEVTANHGLATSAAVRIAHATATFTGCRIAGNDLAGTLVFVGLDSRLTLNGCTLADHPQAGAVGLFLQHGRLAGAFNVVTGIGGAALRAEYDSSVILDASTIAANGSGLVVAENSSAALGDCLIAFNAGAGIATANAMAALACCDVFGNAGGNYGGQLADQTGHDGNLSADPLFCDLAGGDLRLAAGSPALAPGNFCYTQMGARGEGCGLTSAPSAMAAVAQLRPACPNPFNPRTTLSFHLPATARARLEIYALDGKRIATLLDGARPAGVHGVTWDGRDRHGRGAPAGIYLACLTVDGLVSRQRLALVR